MAMIFAGTVLGQGEKKSSHVPVVPPEAFPATMSRMKRERPAVMKSRRISCKNAMGGTRHTIGAGGIGMRRPVDHRLIWSGSPS